MSRVLQALFSPSRCLSTPLSLLVLFGLAALTPISHARTPGAVLSPGVVPSAELILPASGQKYELHLYHLHTGESLDVVYRIGDTYIPSALAELNHFLRDHRTEDVSHYDPREFDLLHNLLTRLGRPNALIDVVCGYRSPWSNNYLRTRGPDTGVAEHSQHVQAKAIDIRVPGVSTRRLDQAALSLHEGGVGYYPVSQFVHVDVGPVRQWSFSGGHSRRGRHYRHRRT
ncbi:MAG TPA: DUF882 domain-containing protein [Acidobacteriaceae bacterium]